MSSHDHADTVLPRPARLKVAPGLLAAAAAAALLLAACAPMGSAPMLAPAPAGTEDVVLPRGANTTLTDPVRYAVSQSQYNFASAPSHLVGRPADAAEAAMLYEYMTAQLLGPYPRREYHPLHPGALVEGRAELRAAIGIAPNAPAQTVIDRLWGASENIRRADRTAAITALSGPAFVLPGEEVLKRLAALPPLPRTGLGASEAYGRFRDQDQGGSGRGRLWR